MKPEVTDVSKPLAYGYSHDIARKFLPLTLFGIALGLFAMMPIDGVMRRDHALLGGLVIAVAIAFLMVLIYRRAQPNVAQLVITSEGITFRLVSEKIIPWDEIWAVGRDKVSGSRDFFSTKVVRLALSEEFYERYTQGNRLASTVGTSGDPCAIFLAYDLDVPHGELYVATWRRWREFSRHAQGTSLAEPIEGHVGIAAASSSENHPLAGSGNLAATRRSRVIERASSFEGMRGLFGLFRGASIVQLLGSATAIAIIVTLLSNLLGYWSTEAQVKGREEAAKWKAWQAEQDREQREFDAEQKRVREKFDRMFACMDETFRRHDLGLGRGPECEKEGK